LLVAALQARELPGQTGLERSDDALLLYSRASLLLKEPLDELGIGLEHTVWIAAADPIANDAYPHL
jgi:hypothetical protein